MDWNAGKPMALAHPAPNTMSVTRPGLGSPRVVTTVSSGGVASQADAVKMGVARALIQFNPELRKALKAEGLLTRDARVKERKKYGQKGARKRFQFSKR